MERENPEKLEKLKEFLKHQAQTSIERGFFRFAIDGPFTDVRINPRSLFLFEEGWCELAADLLLEVPTGGLIGLWLEQEQSEGRNWLEAISKKLENKGVEMPVSWISGLTGEVFGRPLSEYHKNSPVAAFCDINTFGGTFQVLIHKLSEDYGIRVNRCIALIDRHPIPTQTIEGIPFASVLHMPLPIYESTEIPDHLRPTNPWLLPEANFGGSTLLFS